MPQVHVKWIDRRQFMGVDSTKHSVVISSHDAENGVGMRPSELLLVALGGCTSYDVVGILEKKRQQFSAVDVYVDGEQEADPPWPFKRIHVEYVVRGRGVSEAAVAQAIQLSEERYCSVRASITPACDLTSSYRIVEEE